MQVIVIQPGAVDGVFRPLLYFVKAGSDGGDILTGNRITNRLDREAPQVTFEDCGVRWRVHFIHPPVVGLPKIQPFRDSIAGSLLASSVQVIRPHRVQVGGTVHIVEIGAEVHIVLTGKLSRRPA
ncbi:hypothetical protein ES703_113560 [subsurface metagenome]